MDEESPNSPVALATRRLAERQDSGRANALRHVAGMNCGGIARWPPTWGLCYHGAALLVSDYVMEETASSLPSARPFRTGTGTCRDPRSQHTFHKGSGVESLRVFVTGGAGFIGSNLVDRLLARGEDVTVYDNFSTGKRPFIKGALAAGAHLVQGDVLDLDTLTAAVRGHDVVFHLAANADVRFGLEHPRRDLEQNTIATHNVLEAIRLGGVPRLAFSSTGSVYGEPQMFPTPEECPFPIQTSLYGASKLAAEGLISAYAAGFGIQAMIFRFVSILGERYTHGHVFDFFLKLSQDPHEIEVLGNGQQRKSYLYVQDCIEAMLTVLDTETAPVWSLISGRMSIAQ